MQRVGDETAGFSVDVPLTGSVVVIGWGFWSLEVASAFAGTVSEACRGQQRRVKLMLDMRELKPMREEGQQSFSALLRSLGGLGVSAVSIVTSNPLTKLQLVRLATESRVGDIEWISATNSQGRDG